MYKKGQSIVSNENTNQGETENSPARSKGNNMLAIDWSHTRDFAIFDGENARIVPVNKLIDEAKKADMVVIESGAPLSVIYRLCRLTSVYTVDPQYVAKERENRRLPKHKSGNSSGIPVIDGGGRG